MYTLALTSRACSCRYPQYSGHSTPRSSPPDLSNRAQLHQGRSGSQAPPLTLLPPFLPVLQHHPPYCGPQRESSEALVLSRLAGSTLSALDRHLPTVTAQLIVAVHPPHSPGCSHVASAPRSLIRSAQWESRRWTSYRSSCRSTRRTRRRWSRGEDYRSIYFPCVLFMYVHLSLCVCYMQAGSAGRCKRHALY